MRKIFIPLLLAIVFTTVAFPAKAAPLEFAPQYAPEDMHFHASDVPYGPTPSDSYGSMTWVGPYDDTAAPFGGMLIGIDLTCPTVGCSDDSDVYIRYSVEVAYKAGTSVAPYVELSWWGNTENHPPGHTAPINYGYGGCEASVYNPGDGKYYGSCTLIYDATLPSVELYEEADLSGPSGRGSRFWVKFIVKGNTSAYGMLEWSNTISATPIENDCSSYETLQDISSGSILATAESGTTINTIIGTDYILTIMGGALE